MLGGEKELRRYQTKDGGSPFWEWLYSLRDRRALSVILTRLERFAEGNAGSWRSIGHGLFELKIHVGPGYRVYFGEDGDALIILLCGGDKTSQRRDIQKAFMYWKDYQRRKYGT